MHHQKPPPAPVKRVSLAPLTHANNAIQALERIANFFPAVTRDQVHQNLAIHLRAVVSLRLITGSQGRMVPAVEVLLNTASVSELIATGRFRELRS